MVEGLRLEVPGSLFVSEPGSQLQRAVSAATESFHSCC